MGGPGTPVPGVRHGPPCAPSTRRAPPRRRAPARLRGGAAGAGPRRRAGAPAPARRALRGARRGFSVLLPEDTDARDTAEAIGWFLGEDRVALLPSRGVSLALRPRAAAAPRRRARPRPRRARPGRARLRVGARGRRARPAARRPAAADRARVRRRPGHRRPRREPRRRGLRARRPGRGTRAARGSRRPDRRLPDDRPRAAARRVLRRRDREHPRVLAVHAARAPAGRERHDLPGGRARRHGGRRRRDPAARRRGGGSARAPRRPRPAARGHARLRLAAGRRARRLARRGLRRDLARWRGRARSASRRASRSRSRRSGRRSSRAGSRRPRTSSPACSARASTSSSRSPTAARPSGAGRCCAGSRPTCSRRARSRQGLAFAVTPARRGFVWRDLGIALLPDTQVFRRRPPRATAAPGRALASFSDLRTGDYVVHEDHGIAQLLGFETREVAGVTRDYLLLGFRGDDRVYVPHEQIGKVSRYIGADSHAPTLSKLGGKAWDNLKTRAREHLREMAGELLQLYAERQTRPGIAYDVDQEWVERLEAEFPYRETEDQARAIEAVKEDLEAPRPMDRLVCGDVGFGKTEVALRAAFTVAVAGKQVLMLVPTTILAQQHWSTFRDRYRDFPVRVEMVSRFRKPADVKQVLADFGEGKVDVLIGTHRILSRDVIPKDLGLVVVDEEQRFGVAQKELLRQLRLEVDVLALSATPIPRTLHMSLAGLRDISVIETPPEGRRPIRTYVGEYDEELIEPGARARARARRPGFYLHNRVETIEDAAEKLRQLMPGPRVLVAHGQMGERELEDRMLAFLSGDADVLVSTTIIESGLDIPQANTLIVERADALGLAQLYQIRGRVGRRDVPAHAYLFYPDAGRADPGGARAARDARRPHRARRRLRDRDARPRDPRRRRPARRRAVRSRRRARLRALRRDAPRDRRRALRRAAARGAPGPRRRPRRRLRARRATSPPRRSRSTSTAGSRSSRTRTSCASSSIATEDRYGPLPEPVENLFAIQLAKLKVARLGRRLPRLPRRQGLGRAGRARLGRAARAARAGRHRRLLDRPARGDAPSRRARRRAFDWSMLCWTRSGGGMT